LHDKFDRRDIFKMWVKLSNSGDVLKILIPSHSWKIMSGWINYSGKVTSQNMIENEMDNRGSKSDIIKAMSVKEQRVDGSYLKLIYYCYLRLRCTLTGFERSYQIKIPSTQLNIVKHIRDYSNILPMNFVINPWFLTGFTDAEGCFSIKVSYNSKLKTKWRVRAVFSIFCIKKIFLF